VTVAGFGIFRRRRQTRRGLPRASSAANAAQLHRRTADVTSASSLSPMPPTAGIIGALSPDGALHSDRACKCEGCGGLSGIRQALLDKNPCPRRQSNSEIAPLRSADADECCVLGSRIAVASSSLLARSRSDRCVVVVGSGRPSDVGATAAGGCPLRRAAAANHQMAVVDLQLHQGACVVVSGGGRMAVDSATGPSPKSSTLESRGRLSSSSACGLAGPNSSCGFGATNASLTSDGNSQLRLLRQHMQHQFQQQQQELFKTRQKSSPVLDRMT
jgi:hypothetical protein